MPVKLVEQQIQLFGSFLLSIISCAFSLALTYKNQPTVTTTQVHLVNPSEPQGKFQGTSMARRNGRFDDEIFFIFNIFHDRRIGEHLLERMQHKHIFSIV